MLTRLKRIIRLSKYEDPILERLQSLQVAIEDNQRLSNNGLAFDPSKFSDEDASVLSGEAKGEYLPDMTESEVLAYERNERMGWKNFKLPWQHESSE